MNRLYQITTIFYPMIALIAATVLMFIDKSVEGMILAIVAAFGYSYDHRDKID